MSDRAGFMYVYSASTKTRTLSTLACEHTACALSPSANTLSVHLGSGFGTSPILLSLWRPSSKCVFSLWVRPGNMTSYRLKRTPSEEDILNNSWLQEACDDNLCTSPSMALTSTFRSYCSVFSREVSFAWTGIHIITNTASNICTLNRGKYSNDKKGQNHFVKSTHQTKKLNRCSSRLKWSDETLTHSSGLTRAVIFSCIMGFLLQPLLWDMCTHSSMATRLSSYRRSLWK